MCSPPNDFIPVNGPSVSLGKMGKIGWCPITKQWVLPFSEEEVPPRAWLIPGNLLSWCNESQWVDLGQTLSDPVAGPSSSVGHCTGHTPQHLIVGGFADNRIRYGNMRDGFTVSANVTGAWGSGARQNAACWSEAQGVWFYGSQQFDIEPAYTTDFETENLITLPGGGGTNITGYVATDGDRVACVRANNTLPGFQVEFDFYYSDDVVGNAWTRVEAAFTFGQDSALIVDYDRFRKRWVVWCRDDQNQDYTTMHVAWSEDGGDTWQQKTVTVPFFDATTTNQFGMESGRVIDGIIYWSMINSSTNQSAYANLKTTMLASPDFGDTWYRIGPASDGRNSLDSSGGNTLFQGTVGEPKAIVTNGGPVPGGSANDRWIAYVPVLEYGGEVVTGPPA